MPRRPAIVTQADIARVIKACQAARLSIARIVVKGDRVVIEAGVGENDLHALPVEHRREIVL
jgi:hypothetical protein